MLNDFIQSNVELLHCFTDEIATYNARKDIDYKIVEDFYKFIISIENEKQQIVIDNIYTKLSNLKIKENDDLPF